MDAIRHDAYNFLTQVSFEVDAFEDKVRSPDGWLRTATISHLHCSLGVDREEAANILDVWLRPKGPGSFKVEFLLAMHDKTWTTTILKVPYSAIPLDQEQSSDALLDWVLAVDGPASKAAFGDVALWAVYNVSPDADEPEDLTCPGCGCNPGEGRTQDCSHPDGCGWRGHNGGPQ